jgi:transcriptional regulator with XRE-family HTH domain
MATQKVDPRQPDSTDVEVGRLVRALRMSRGLSQTDLANRIGVAFQQVQKYESGANRITMGRLTNIAKLFKVSVPYLLSGSREAALKSSTKDSYTEALEMLGLLGAQRLLRAFAAIPSKPASLRKSLVEMVEYTAAAAAARARGEETRKRARRR